MTDHPEPEPIEWTPTNPLSRAIWRWKWRSDPSAPKLIANNAVDASPHGWSGVDFYGRSEQPVYTYKGETYRRADVRRTGRSTWTIHLRDPADFHATSNAQGDRQTTSGDSDDRGYTVHYTDNETEQRAPDGKRVDGQE